MTPIERAQAVAHAQEILGVATHATETELRRAWKKLVFEMHPDRGQGTSQELANINAAFNLLCNRSRQPSLKSASDNVAPTRKTDRTGVKPTRVRSRPCANSKVSLLTELVVARCRRALEDGRASQADHVPSAIRRSGREIEYIVESPLAKGVNRIALPICDYRGTRKQTTRRITFTASTDGAGTFAIPEQLRRDLFPGAREVTIRFAKSCS